MENSLCVHRTLQHGTEDGGRNFPPREQQQSISIFRIWLSKAAVGKCSSNSLPFTYGKALRLSLMLRRYFSLGVLSTSESCASVAARLVPSSSVVTSR